MWLIWSCYLELLFGVIIVKIGVVILLIKVVGLINFIWMNMKVSKNCEVLVSVVGFDFVVLWFVWG